MISAVPFTVTTTVEGMDAQKDALAIELNERLAGDLTVEVVAGGKRGGLRNALIAHAQANKRRNRVYLGNEAMQVVRFLARDLASRLASVRSAVGKAIGDEMIESIAKNVQKQQNVEGDKFTPLTAGYALRKQRKHGFVLPILKATGDLLGGLRVRILRSRR